jgi:hypothetical protein
MTLTREEIRAIVETATYFGAVGWGDARGL